MVPGEVVVAVDRGPVALAPGRERRLLRVLNAGDRPVQVGSHFHFADVNDALECDRAVAAGFRLDIPAGTSLRLEPGIEREVSLVALGGPGVVPGLRLRDAPRRADRLPEGGA